MAFRVKTPFALVNVLLRDAYCGALTATLSSTSLFVDKREKVKEYKL